MENWIEVFGYLGSVIVLISLMMSNILKLRWINLVGATIFSTYGLLIGAVPVFVLNGLIAIIDVYYLVGMYRAKELFSLMEQKSNDPLLDKFLTFFQADIHKFFPDFNRQTEQSATYVLVFRDVLPVGVFAYRKISEVGAEVVLDYISPNYRDYKNAEYLINTRKERFINEGIKQLETHSDVPIHQKYLRKIGFKPHTNSSSQFVKVLSK